jgi:hypothetical protein
MFDRCIFGGMGYSQRLGRPHMRAGLAIFHAIKVYPLFVHSNCYVPAPFEWNSSVDWLLGWIKHNCTKKCRFDVYGFSNGAGVWFPKFQSGLEGTGRRIHSACLIDPVNKWGRANPVRWFPSGWFGGGRTVVRSDRCVVFTQNSDYPRSSGVDWYDHDGVAGTPETVKMDMPHNLMDNAYPVWRRIVEEFTKDSEK